jgi:polar amino acid transport system ATP-binding protein
VIEVKNVTKNFGSACVLDQISLTFANKTIVGLAGPSGGGKSTLLRCIGKLENIDSGSIKCEVKTGFMFQDFQLFPHMSVIENLVYAPDLHDKTKDHRKQALKLLTKLGIADKQNNYPHNLSGGQKQRVALARSLMMHPGLLLCDEPTSGLDVATTLDVVTLLESIRDMGVTMIIASHDLDFLSKIADRIVLLKGGKIIQDIVPKDIADPIDHLKRYY